MSTMSPKGYRAPSAPLFAITTRWPRGLSVSSWDARAGRGLGEIAGAAAGPGAAVVPLRASAGCTGGEVMGSLPGGGPGRTPTAGTPGRTDSGNGDSACGGGCCGRISRAAPQNRQNCALASTVPRHRVHTRGPSAAVRAALPPRSTTRMGAIGDGGDVTADALATGGPADGDGAAGPAEAGAAAYRCGDDAGTTTGSRVLPQDVQ